MASMVERYSRPESKRARSTFRVRQAETSEMLLSVFRTRWPWRSRLAVRFRRKMADGEQTTIVSIVAPRGENTVDKRSYTHPYGRLNASRQPVS
ncbi:hypothetical protein D3C72_1929690 [compost metagenome]